MFLGVIVNPKARKNRAAPRERIDELRRLVGPWGEVHETASIDDLRDTIAQIGPRVTTWWATVATARCTG